MTLPARNDAALRAADSPRGAGFCFLDTASGSGVALLGKDPEGILSGRDRHYRWRERSGLTRHLSGCPFGLAAEILRDHPDWTAIGYWSYDLRLSVERLPDRALDDLCLPELHLAFFDHPTRIPVSNEDTGAMPPTGGDPGCAIRSTPRADYTRSVRRILEYIAAGDCYQVNLSQRFQTPYRGDPWALYSRLRRLSPAPFAAYLDCGDHQVLSASPELFIRVTDGWVETRPIKGTRARAADPIADGLAAEQLGTSPKDRAELLMIVDLERNDLGRVCRYGTVHVPELYRLESFSNVHHLVATVRGRLRPEIGPLECLRQVFPGGSITGAPKIRAMEIIDELEPVRRGVYTGAIGWVNGRGEGEWNIAIRTMVLKDGMASFHAGGGIVADSDPDAEYDETLAKAAGMLAALAPDHPRG